MASPAGTLRIEQYLPVVMQNGGLYTELPLKIAGDLTVTGTTNLSGISLTDLTTTGNTTLGDAVSDTTTINGATTIVTTAVAGLTVGANGATNPVLRVDANTASVATGISIVGAAAGAGVNLRALSSGNDENMTINAKGAGTLTLNPVATGNIVLSRAMTGVSLSMTGIATLLSGTAVPATAGAVAAGAPIVLNTNGITVEATTNIPTHNRPIGSICINLGGNSTSTRVYVATSAAGAWTSLTTAA